MDAHRTPPLQAPAHGLALSTSRVPLHAAPAPCSPGAFYVQRCDPSSLFWMDLLPVPLHTKAPGHACPGPQPCRPSPLCPPLPTSKHYRHLTLTFSIHPLHLINLTRRCILDPSFQTLRLQPTSCPTAVCRTPHALPHSLKPIGWAVWAGPDRPHPQFMPPHNTPVQPRNIPACRRMPAPPAPVPTRLPSPRATHALSPPTTAVPPLAVIFVFGGLVPHVPILLTGRSVTLRRPRGRLVLPRPASHLF